MTGFKKSLIKISSLRLMPTVLIKCCRIFLMNAHNKKKVIVALVQHLGDNVAAEPLDSYIRQSDADSFIIRIVGNKFSEVIKYNPHYNKIITVSCLSEWIYLKSILQVFYKVYDLHVHKSFCNIYRLAINNPNKFGITVSNYYNHGNLLQIFCINAGLPIINKKPVYWIAPDVVMPSLPAKFAVIHVSSNSYEREWDNHKWVELIKYISNNYSIPVIEIGIQSSLNYQDDNYINYCGKLSFSEIALVISQSTIFIGIDSAFAHFANSFEIRKLILLGHFNVFSNYLPYSGLSEEEVKECILQYEGELSQLAVETVIRKVKSIL